MSALYNPWAVPLICMAAMLQTILTLATTQNNSEVILHIKIKSRNSLRV